jgi:tRNA threonylcarbamoyladenosine biosynthesis protein TsaB
MNILAFDTCFGACSVALSRSLSSDVAVPETRAVQVTSRFARMQTGHAEALMPMIGAVAEEAGIGVGQIDRIMVTHGPGTFTGVRVGVAAARALALATGARASGFSSLALIAREVRERLLAERCAEVFGGSGHAPAAWMFEELAKMDIAVAIDARRGQIYFQLFGGEQQGGALTTPLLVSPEQAVGYLRQRATTVAGSGAELVAAAGAGSHSQLIRRYEDIEPNARYLLAFATGIAADPLRPLYLRAPDAKPQVGKSLPRAL